tara:strand:- start:138 stop:1142 length:1005 start_codon:yes stop_codon:yes gene_type:complete
MESSLERKSSRNHIARLLQDDWYGDLATILTTILEGTHEFFSSEGIRPLLFPITTGSVSSPMGYGSDSLPVQVNIKNNDVYLSDSMQFSLEIGARMFPNGAYYIMPSFRGEEVDERHLNEFFHSEAEIHGSLQDVMALVERYLVFLARRTLSAASSLKQEYDLSHVKKFVEEPASFFNHIRYDEAVSQLRAIPGALDQCETGYEVISSLGERELMKIHGEFTWLTHMPWLNVPFYQSREGDTAYSLSADLLAGIGEIVGCGQRVNSPEELAASMEYHRIRSEQYSWYAEMRDVRPLQTSGFGLGIERFILWFTNKKDIRECSLLLRNHRTISWP